MTFKYRVFALGLLFGALALNGFGSADAADFASRRFSVEVRGQGPDVILIPGLASSSRVWDATADRLDDTHRVHLVQVNGFAGAAAAGNAQGPVLAPLVEELNRYVVAQKLNRPAVIGHSMGGVTALTLAARHPKAVGRVMVVDALPFFSLLIDPKATVQSMTAPADAARDGMLAMPQDRFTASQTMAMMRLIKTPEARARHAAFSAASDKAVVARVMHEVMLADLRPQLARVTAPVTVLYAWDPMFGVPAAGWDALWTGAYAGLKTGRLVRVDDSFHFIMEDQPARFASEVEAFLSPR